MNDNNKVVDGLLVLQYQSGNDKALPLLVKRWHKKFCSKAYWITKDADVSKDIAQESWRLIMNKLQSLKDPNSFGGWALTIVYRKAIDWIRTHKKEDEKLHEYYNDRVIDEHEPNDNEHLKKELLKAIKSLPENQQLVINLFYVEDYTLKEISEILNISAGTVKSRLFHAREKLKKSIKNRRNY